MATPPSLEEIRAQFPAITGERATGDRFLDAAGGSQIPAVVIDRLTDFYTGANAQLGAFTGSSQRGGALVEAAHDWLATWLGVDPKQYAVILGSSASTLLAMLSGLIARAPGTRDELILAEAGHESNLGPWLRAGGSVKWWGADATTGESSLDELQSLLSKKTRLVAVHQVSNLLGTVEPLEEITALSHDAGAWVVADGVAYAPHRAPRVAEWNVDAYTFSLYKTFGPEIAVLAVRWDRLEELPTANHDFVERGSTASFELGGTPRSSAAAALAVAEYFAFLVGHSPPAPGVGLDRAGVVAAYDRIAELETPLLERVLADLRSRPAVKIIGPNDDTPRVATVSFTVPEVKSRAIAEAAGARGLGVRSGHFYARRLADRLGLDPDDGAVRISLVHTNAPSELAEWETFLDEFAPRAR